MDYLCNGLEVLVIDPAGDIVRRGSAARFLQTLPAMCRYLAYCKREKVCKSLGVTIWILTHLLQNRQDLLATYMTNCCKVNDNMVQKHNAQTYRCLPDNCMQTPETVGVAACRSQIKRNYFDAVSKSGNTDQTPQRRSPCEIYREETRHESDKARRQTAFMANFLD
jgi:hypothetical protein